VPIAPLLDLPSGAMAVIDANIFIYAMRGLSPQCQNLLERCRAQEVFGVMTLEVVNEVSHRLMLAEAVEKAIIIRPAANLLAGKRGSIARLQKYWTLTAQIFTMNLAVIPLDEARVRRIWFARFSKRSRTWN
jgi:predicted nucleic acid-binding protein